MTSLEIQLRFIRDRGWSNDSLLVAAFCRKYVTTQLLSNEIVDVIVAFFTVMESWNTELKGDHIIVKGTDNDTIEFTKDYSFNSASCAESAYGMQPVSDEGIHQWKVEIVRLKDNGITLIPLSVGLVTGDMNRERKDVNTYFGGFGSKQFELAISRRMSSHGHPKETYLTLRCGNQRINLRQTCGEGDVIGITLHLNQGSAVQCFALSMMKS